MFGEGLIKGLGITFKNFFRKAVTEQYPEFRPNLPDRFHGSFALNAEKCIACNLCANACPNHVIQIEAEKDENNKKQLSGYKMFTERCLYCGLCVEACPTDAIKFTKDFELAKYFRDMVNIDFAADVEVGRKAKAEKAAAKAKEEKAAQPEEGKEVSE